MQQGGYEFKKQVLGVRLESMRLSQIISDGYFKRWDIWYDTLFSVVFSFVVLIAVKERRLCQGL